MLLINIIINLRMRMHIQSF